MAIDITKDKLLTFDEAAEFFPVRGGGHIQAQTVNRWTVVGCKGVKLEAVPVGGKLYTTADALREFSRKLSAVRGTAEASGEEPVSDADKHARNELEKEGFVVAR